MTCAVCRQACREIKNTDPDCEHCRPPIHEGNIEAWNIANTIGIGSSESVQGVLEVCRMMGVQDEAEVYMKISELNSAIRSSAE